MWKTLICQGEEYNGFSVNEIGQIKNNITGTVYKFYLNRNGYYMVTVSLGSRNHKKVFKSHKAVAETFIPNPNSLSQVNHKDGNKLNNHVSNLEWCTPKENTQHAINTGLINFDYLIGVNHLKSKLKQKEIQYIRQNYIPYDKNFGCRALAKKFGVHHSIIEKIIHHKGYKN